MAEKSRKSAGTLRRLPATVLICAVVIVLLSYAFSAKNTYLLSDDNSVRSVTEYGNVLTDSNFCSEDSCMVTLRSGSRETLIPCNADQTVGDALAKAGIELSEDDYLNAYFGDYVYDGMILELTLSPAPVPSVQTEEISDLSQGSDISQRPMLSALSYSSIAETRSGNSYSSAAAFYSSGLFSVASQRTTADLSAGTYSPLNDPDAAHEYGSGITVFGEGGNYTGETVWSFDDNCGTITTATGETLSYSYVVDVSATAYTTENAHNRITATGTVARVGAIAVDPTVIPYGTRMYIVSRYGNWIYGYATAEDCGGGIKGHRVDLFFDTIYECFQFGVRDARIYILN